MVLGQSNEKGVPVLGVSPDGPAERAGIRQGDVIVGMMGKPLTGGSEDPRAVLAEVMDGVKVGDELNVTVLREDSEEVFTVKADRREPFSWQSIVRLPTAPDAPDAPGAPHVIRRIDLPEIDRAELREKLEAMESELRNIEVIVNTDKIARIAHGDGESWEYRFETFSDLGGDVLTEANVWFGLPATRGLKMAEVNEDLGQYFDVDSGVLVLSAREDNDLQLRSGDVIMSVGDQAVSRPADVIRALREWEPGASIDIAIKRDRRETTLEVVLPERSIGHRLVPMDEDHLIHEASQPD